MCIDFKILNSACPKDYYQLPNVDCKVESVMGFIYKCFMDAYKGYHQIQIAEKDEEKMAFYTDQGTNLEAYADDMVIKSKDEKMLLADIAETFDNLKRINMKLNPKKCSFGVEEGKFLGYMEREAMSCAICISKPIITDQSIRNILNNTETSRKLGEYAAELGAYNITFIPRNAVKGHVLAYFLSEAPEGEKEELYFRMPEVPLKKDDTESWTLFTDRAFSLKGSWAGLVLIRPSGIEYTYALRLTFLKVKVDSKLVASQINGNYEASKDGMIKYLAKAREYAFVFKSFSIENIPKNMNQKADMLSKLALVVFNHLIKEVLVDVLNERSTKSQKVHTVVEEEGDNWMNPIIRCLEEGIWPKDKNEARGLRAKISQYAIESGVLFKKGYLVPMLREGYNKEEMRLNLDLLQERREMAAIREARYKTKMEQYYNKKVRPSGFRPGEFVFQRNKASRVEDQGKLGPK
nr:reverse transcriptase domain-containing protein [Tanacetum cinerariifolium]